MGGRAPALKSCCLTGLALIGQNAPMNTSRCTFFRAARWLAFLMGAACVGPVLAQNSYPSKPIVMVVPQTAGGTNDIVGRVVSQKLAEVLGTAVAVESRPGAGGNTGFIGINRQRRSGKSLAEEA